jgi:lipopolysaccharide transport system ATP-binding protein
MTIQANADIEHPVIGYSFLDLKGNQVVGALSSNFPDGDVPQLVKGETYRIEINGKNSLAQGAYTLNVGIENIVQLNLVHQFLEVIESARIFRSIFGSQTENIFPAMVWQEVDFKVHKIGVN